MAWLGEVRSGEARCGRQARLGAARQGRCVVRFGRRGMAW